MESHHRPLQSFLDYLKFEKRYSQHTVVSYQTDLLAFFDFVVGQYGETPLSQISHSVVRTWLASLKDAGLSAKSINRKISALKSFFKHQVKMGVIGQSPMAKVVAPKPEKRLPQFVSEKDMQRLFENLPPPTDWNGQVEQAMLLLFYHTGMRLSELIGLKETNVDLAAGSVKVLGKGNKERVVPIGAGLKEALQAYRSKKEERFPECPSAAFFVSEAGKPLTPRAVYTSVKSHLSQVTTIEKRSPHVLRHTFATHLMNNGADLNAVKELLGHTSMAATQVYTHNTIEKLKNVHKRAHPKA